MGAIATALHDLFTASSPDVWNDPTAWSPFGGFGGGAGSYANYPTTSGEAVSEKTALLVSTHFACIRCKSEDLSVIPKEVYELDGEGEKIIQRDHPAYSILNVQMNPEMTAAKGYETLLAHAGGFKKGVAEIEWESDRLTPRWLWPLDPISVTKKRVRGRIWYEHRVENGDPVMLPAEDVVEIIGPSYDGQIGYSMAELARYVIGLALAAQKFQGSFFGNGAWLGGIIQNLPKGMKPEDRTALLASFNERHQTSGRAFGVGALPGEAEWKEVGVNPQEGMVEPTLNFTVDDLCRFHRVPPHKVQNYANAHFNNVESAEIVYRGDSLLPLGTVAEQEFARKLLPTGWIVRHNYNAFQRVDFKTQQEALAVGRMWGWWTINDCLKKLGENPTDEPWGEMRLIPANMIPIERAYEVRDQTSTNSPPPKSKPDPSAIKEAYLPLVIEGLRRSADKEQKRVKYLRGKHKGNDGEVNAFYGEHKLYVAQNVVPILGSMARVLRGTANAERLQVVGEMYLSEYIAERPAQNGPVDDEWLTAFAGRWVDATITASEIEEAA